MSDLQNSNQPVSATSRAPKTWDFMETTFVALIAYAVLVLTVDLSVDVILSMQDGVEKLTPAQLEQLAMQGRWHGAALIIACPTTLAATALSSLIWELYHTKYDGLIRLWIGICGGVLCAIRWRTNSTWLTVIAHSATNTVVFFTAGPYI